MLSVPDEGCNGNASCAVNLISTFLLYHNTFLFRCFNTVCNINTHFSFDVFYAIINLRIVNFYKPWSNMKIVMLFRDFDVIGLLFHDFDVIDLPIM